MTHCMRRYASSSERSFSRATVACVESEARPDEVPAAFDDARGLAAMAARDCERDVR